jgi:hypothetical protein
MKPLDIDSWFDHTYKQKIKKHSIIHFIGDAGIGKKKKIYELAKSYNVNTLDINCIHGKSHLDIKKKEFTAEIKYIITHKNIEFYLTGKETLLVIHNLHIIRDKLFLDELFDLNSTPNISSSIICIFNKMFISERLISHISKKCTAFYMLKKCKHELRNILEENHKLHINLNFIHLSEKFIDHAIETSNGNIYSLLIAWKKHILISLDTEPCLFLDFQDNENDYGNDGNDYENDYKENTKTLIGNCFEKLCDKNIPFYKKIDLTKIYSSLLKLLMSKHICNGLDRISIPFVDKLKLCKNMMTSLSKGDSIQGKYNLNYATILQCIYPTFVIDNSTIKSLILPSYPSTSNNQVVRIYPHHPEQGIFIYVFLIKYLTVIFDNHTASKKMKKNEDHFLLKNIQDWKNIILNFDNNLVYESTLKYYKLFPNYTISKKKINRFFKVIDS